MAKHYVEFKRGYPYDGTIFYETVETRDCDTLTEARKKAWSWLNKYKRSGVDISEYIDNTPYHIKKVGEAFWHNNQKVYVTKGIFYALNRDGTLGREVYRF